MMFMFMAKFNAQAYIHPPIPSKLHVLFWKAREHTEGLVLCNEDKEKWGKYHSSVNSLCVLGTVDFLSQPPCILLLNRRAGELKGTFPRCLCN